jgi:hypothetical protein
VTTAALHGSTALAPVPERMIRVRVFTDAITGDPVELPPMPWGSTIREIVDAIPLEPKQEGRRRLFEAHLGPHQVPRDRWHRVRPAAYAEHCPVVLSIRFPLHGGRRGGGGSKILSALAAIALIGLTVFTGGGGFGFLGAAFAEGGLGAKILGAAVSIGGSLLLQGLQPTPKQDKVDDIGFASAQNNFEPGGYLPRVIGRRRVAPMTVVPPFTTINNGEQRADNSYRYSQYVTAVYALAGRHVVGTVYADNVDLDTVGGVEVEVREGTDADTPLTLVTDTRLEDPINIQMTEWEVDPDEDEEGWIQIFGTEAEAEPQWHRMETAESPDEFRIEFLMPNGLNYADPSDGTNKPSAVAVRLRMRPRDGDTWGDWVNLPEMMIKAKEPNNGIRMHLVIRWVDAYPTEAGSKWPAEANTGKVAGDIALSRIKGISEIYTHADWASDLLTVDGDGFEQWHYESDKRVYLYLLTSSYPKGRWQFEVKRSWAFRYASWDFAAKTFSITEGDFNDLFRPITRSDPMDRTWIRFNPANFAHQLTIPSVQNVWDEYPIADDGDPVTLIAVRAKNRQLGTITVDASGVCEAWDAETETWVADQTTSNPADWYRHVLTDATHNAEPVDESLLDLPALQDWAEWAPAEGHEVNAVIRDKSVLETLQLIAQSGWASPIFGAKYGVVIDRPRTGGPVGLITQRNAKFGAAEKPFADLPHALRVTFSDAANDDKAAEILVYAEGYAASAGVGVLEATRFETVTYEGITSETEAVARAELDLAWARYRGTLHPFSLDFEHLEFQRGDLVLMENDILGQTGGRGRIRAVETDGGGLFTAMLLDEIPHRGASQEDLWSVAELEDEGDLLDINAPPAGVQIRFADGTIQAFEIEDPGSDQSRLVFTTPFASPAVTEGLLVAVGTLARVARPVLIWDIQPGPDLTAEIVAIDYAETEIYG